MLLLDANKIKGNGDTLKIEVNQIKNNYPQKTLIVVVNKMDALTSDELKNISSMLGNIEALHYLSLIHI